MVCLYLPPNAWECLSIVHPHSMKIHSLDLPSFADFSEEEDEFIMAEENNHEGAGAAADGDDDIDQENIRNLHIDGNLIYPYKV